MSEIFLQAEREGSRRRGGGLGQAQTGRQREDAGLHSGVGGLLLLLHDLL